MGEDDDRRELYYRGQLKAISRSAMIVILFSGAALFMANQLWHTDGLLRSRKQLQNVTYKLAGVDHLIWSTSEQAVLADLTEAIWKVRGMSKSDILAIEVTRGGTQIAAARGFATRPGTVDELLEMANEGKISGRIPSIALDQDSIQKAVMALFRTLRHPDPLRHPLPWEENGQWQRIFVGVHEVHWGAPCNLTVALQPTDTTGHGYWPTQLYTLPMKIRSFEACKIDSASLAGLRKSLGMRKDQVLAMAYPSFGAQDSVGRLAITAAADWFATEADRRRERLGYGGVSIGTQAALEFLPWVCLVALLNLLTRIRGWKWPGSVDRDELAAVWPGAGTGWMARAYRIGQFLVIPSTGLIALAWEGSIYSGFSSLAVALWLIASGAVAAGIVALLAVDSAPILVATGVPGRTSERRLPPVPQ
jgi:hypothetical protein